MQHRHQLRAAGHRPHRRLGAGYERLRPHPQPTDQFWPFQFTEAGIFVAVTTAALGATICCRAGAPASRRRRHVMPVHSQRLATSPARPARLAAMAPHRTAQINSLCTAAANRAPSHPGVPNGGSVCVLRDLQCHSA